MAGLLILKHLRNLSDESAVLQWNENAYYQYFCGMEAFSIDAPCEEGIELILKESGGTGFIDSTVQENNVTFPTDTKPAKKIIAECKKIADEKSFPVRQSYTQTLKFLYRNQRFRNHPKSRKKALRADRKLRTIAGRDAISTRAYLAMPSM